LPKLFGIEDVSGNFFERVGHVLWSLPETHVPSLLIGLGSIALFVILSRALPHRPTTLVVVGAAIAVMSVFGLSGRGIRIVGELPTGLPGIGLPNLHLSDISTLLPTALACFMLAYGETISSARTFAQKHGYDVNPEQELTALGVANLATGLAQGFPVAGGMSQTAVNDMGGASSPMALVVNSGAIALTLMFFAPIFHDLPEPVLASVVLMAASQMVRFEDLRRLRLASRSEFHISLLALFGVLFLGLLDGLLVAAIGSVVVLIAHTSRPPVVVLGRDPLTGEFVNRARCPNAVDPPGALVVRSAGAWLYFNAEHIRRRILDLLDEAPAGTTTVVIDFSMVPTIDTTAGSALRALARSLGTRGIAIELAELRDEVVDNLEAVGVAKDLCPMAAHRKIEDCLAQAC
jgi:MFS superfamily sulfate permease-like transporter